MIGHTKEPWHVEINEAEDANFCDRWPTIHSVDSEIIGTEGLFTDIETDKANARRIVACINACAGLSTEMLESAALNPPVKSAFNGYITMKEKRDDLLVIVKELRDTFTNIYSQSPEGRAYLEKMNSAILKATA